MGNLKVMVVEDNEIDMTVITNALKHAGIDYLAVPESKYALEAAIKYKPSIVILDLGMPKGDGKQVQRQLKTHPATSDVKIIFLTASDNIKDVVYGLNMQASAYFEKGVKIGQVINSINALDGTSRIRSSIDNFSAYNKRLASKYESICSTETGGDLCGIQS